MAYRPDAGEPMALLEAAILTGGVAHALLLSDLYFGTPVPPAGLAQAVGRWRPELLGSFLLAMPFAFFAIWPLGALAWAAGARARRGWRAAAFIAAAMVAGCAGVALASVAFDLSLRQPAIVIANGTAAGFGFAVITLLLRSLQPHRMRV